MILGIDKFQIDGTWLGSIRLVYNMFIKIFGIYSLIFLNMPAMENWWPVLVYYALYYIY